MTSKAVPEVQARLEQWWARLQAQGYRLTLPREAVTRVLAEADRVLEVMEVFQRARAYYPRLGLVTVYRTLDKLIEVGLVQRVHRPDGCGAYVAVPEGHVHLALCSACGRAHFFEGDDIGALMAEVARQSGFRMQSHWLQFFGLCPECQQKHEEVQ